VTRNVRANFGFYRQISERFGMHGIAPPPVISDEQGYSALESFAQLETVGQKVPCREPQLLQQVLRAKAYLNLQINMWAEGIKEKTFFMWEFKADFPWFKEWVWKAVENQANK
jgi:hypothetical protein